MTRSQIEAFFAEEPRLRDLIALCQAELCAEEIWLFGIRARGDHHAHSDWDILVIVRDDAPKEATNPLTVWRVGRRSGVMLDLIAVRKADFEDAQDAVTTLSYVVKQEGIRLDR